ncbi:MAG: cytochrome c-type biogenesis protein [Actinomycetota bacterium]
MAAAVGLLLLAPGPASAAPDDVANSVAQKVMSPFCPGLTLHDCPSDAAAELREEIAGWARQGWSEERIIDELEAEFGPGIRAAPPTEGSGLVAWLLPAVALAGAAGLGVLLARRWTRNRSADQGVASPVDADERARIEAELREIREQA